MSKDTKLVVRQCDCGCCYLVAEKCVWEDGESYYDVSIVDSYYNGYTGLASRIRHALKALFGKPVYYNGLYIGSEEEYKALVDELYGLADWRSQDKVDE